MSIEKQYCYKLKFKNQFLMRSWLTAYPQEVSELIPEENAVIVYRRAMLTQAGVERVLAGVQDYGAKLDYSERRTDVNADRFYLDQDDSSHWYIVPVGKSQEFSDWTNYDEDTDFSEWVDAGNDPDAFVPKFSEPDDVIRVGGSYTRVTFTDPKIS